MAAVLLALVAATLSPGPAAADEPMQDVIVTLRARAGLDQVARTGSRRQRRERVIDALQATADTAQRPLLRMLADLGPQVERIRPFWIADVVALRATPTAIAQIRARPDVQSVTPETVFAAPPAAAASAPAEANLAQVGATDLWARGLTGQGVVVAILDTGVDRAHPDLTDRWRSGGWYDPYGQHPGAPVDFSGHGTWIAGTLVGGSAGGTAIGMAPDARWIAARVFDDSGQGTSSAIHAALQWTVDPDGDPATDDGADVVNNSWGYGSPGCNLEFQADLSALRALDILPVFSAGNSGPSPASSYSPANYPESFAVGAVDGADAVLSDSSRGPSTCGGRARVYPDVVAPGLNIRTSDLFGLWTTVSGTSAAAPHVAGALALLLSGHPGLSAAAQETAVVAGAVDRGASGPDDAYGNGRLAALSAWESIALADPGGPVTSLVTVTPDPSNLSSAPVVRAIADDSTAGGSAIASAEAFVDQPGADGAGAPLTLTAPGVVQTEVSGALTGAYGEGGHVVYVHSRDAAGRWGPMATALFTVDVSPPALSGLAVAPTPTGGTPTVSMTASAADAGGVAAAEATETGARVPAFDGTVTAADGAFGGPSEALTKALAVSGWSAGEHRLQMRARDLAGNWSPWSAVSLIVAAPDGIFADGFETGTTGRWSQTVNASRLAIVAQGAPVGSAALSATISGAAPAYVQDDSPTAEPSYRARFWFDPQAAVTATSGHDILTGLDGGGVPLFRVVYRRTAAGALQLRVGARRSGGHTWTPWTRIPLGPHAVEFGWAAGEAGSVSLTVDGVVKSTVTGLSNAALRLEAVRLGPSGDLAGTTSGTEIFDAFASTRSTVVGP